MSARHLTLAVALCALLSPAAAHAAAPTALPTQTLTLTAGQAVARDCFTRLLPTGTPGVARTTYTGRANGAATFRSAGTRGDWDLTLFDRNGRKLDASADGSSTEVVSTWLSLGDRVIVQGCRRTAAAPRSLPVTVNAVVAARPAATGFRPRVVTVRHHGVAQIHALEELGLDVTEMRTDKTVDVVVQSRKELGLLEKTGLGFHTKVGDLDQQFAAARRADARTTRAATGSLLPTGRTTYRNYEDFGAEMKALAAAHPSIVKPVQLPVKSGEGRVIEGLEIGENVQAPEDGRPVFLVVGMHHAREWPSAEIALEWAYYLVNGYTAGDERTSNIVRHSRVIVVPIVNPDGFVSTKKPSDLELDPTVNGATGTASYRRKNCIGPFPAGTPCELQNGTDPNRNYGAGWGGVGASADPTDQTYRGTGPFSDPEPRAVQSLGQTRQITTMITIHNVAALVLRPPGRSSDGLAPDEERLKALGDAMSKATGYVSQYGWELYDTSGTTEDWFYAATGSFGYTIELGPYDGDFHMPYRTGVINEWNGEGVRDSEAGMKPNKGQGMRVALLTAAEQAIDTQDHSVLEGTAPAGSVLKLSKAFQTETSPVCRGTLSFPVAFVNPPLSDVTKDQCVAPEDAPRTFDDKVETTMTVPADGTFVWNVNPSTRPFVAKAGKSESYSLTCDGKTSQVTVARGQRLTGLTPCA
jgi:hypothetical protein